MKRLRITYKGEVYDIDVEELDIVLKEPISAQEQLALAAASEQTETEQSIDDLLQVESPMSGRIVKLFVKTGSQVEEDDPIAILEAMKMESRILADRSGTIKELYVEVGQLVDTDAVIAIIG